MSAEKVIYNLLKNDAALTALVPLDRIYAGVIPQGVTLPAIAYGYISGVYETRPVSMNEPYSLVTDRIQVSVQAKDYPTQKLLIKAVRKACKNKRGTIAGVRVDKVISERPGPDMRNDDLGLFMQTLDFRVTYAEPNT